MTFNLRPKTFVVTTQRIEAAFSCQGSKMNQRAEKNKKTAATGQIQLSEGKPLVSGGKTENGDSIEVPKKSQKRSTVPHPLWCL